jgi:uncharacterized protein YjlB
MSPSPAKSRPQVEAVWLAEDAAGCVPNNARVPLVVYRQAFDAGDAAAERRIEALFARNGWSGAWVNGIYPFHHFHATTHEVLGIARGSARVQFGGPSGPVLELAAGDAVMIPAGGGHCRKSSAADLSVVGAYPGGADWDLRRANAEDYRSALPLIAAVPPPSCDPVLGADGPACKAREG